MSEAEQWADVQDAFGCPGCRHADEEALGHAPCCTFVRLPNPDAETGRCLNRRPDFAKSKEGYGMQHRACRVCGHLVRIRAGDERLHRGCAVQEGVSRPQRVFPVPPPQACPICGTMTTHLFCSVRCAADFADLQDAQRALLCKPGSVLRSKEGQA